jgi:Uma2 family endonuclease
MIGRDHDPIAGVSAVSSSPARTITPAEYLEAERAAESKSEYYAGQVSAMTGASLAHNRIVSNLVRVLGNELEGTPCEVLPSDMRLHVVATGLYTYPDVTIVCGVPELEDEHRDTLLNPIVLIEVLSASTESYDRGQKAEHYRQIPSLQEYLIVRQDAPRIERYHRRSEREWTLTEAIGFEEGVQLASVPCSLALREVYERALG